MEKLIRCALCTQLIEESKAITIKDFQKVKSKKVCFDCNKMLENAPNKDKLERKDKKKWKRKKKR